MHTWRRFGPQIYNSLKNVGSLLVPFHFSPIVLSVENMDTLPWSCLCAQKEAPSLPFISWDVHTPRQRSYTMSNWSYFPPRIQQENFTRKHWLVVPKRLFQNFNGSMGISPDWNRDPQQKFPMDLPHQQESWELECLRAFKLSNNPTVPVSNKTAEKFAFSEQPACSQSC